MQSLRSLLSALPCVVSSPIEQDDAQLVKANQHGDQIAFALLIQRHQRRVFNLALGMLQDYDDASESTQEAFLAAWQGLPGFRGEARFPTWLYRITYHYCMRQLERREQFITHAIDYVQGRMYMSLNSRPRASRDVDSPAVIAKWMRRCGLPFAILAWAAVALLLLWLAGHVVQTLFLLTIASLLAYALVPAVKFFNRFMPRFLAILIVYLLVLGALSALLYLIVSTAIVQFISLSAYVRFLLSPEKGGQLSQLEQTLRSFGLSQNQIAAARDQVVTGIEGFAGSVVPLLTGLVNAVLDVILVAVMSIYLVSSGSHVSDWLRRNMPDQQQGRMRFLLDTLQRVIGGYIRGQLLMCGLIGLLVGIGMQLIGVPFALLLGVLAFVLEFIPVLGTLVSGAVCVLLALSKGWVIAVIVLVYFVVVHVIEGDVVGPHIVGKTIGLHPVVSLVALIAGAELFGIAGALFASPVAGVLQALLIALWTEWREIHPKEFQRAKDAAVEKVGETVGETPGDPEPRPKLLS